MSDTKEPGWTKGEWRLVTNTNGSWELGVGVPYFNFIVCDRGALEHRAVESIANARLIAAAPDLYSALDAAHEHVCSLCCPSVWKTVEGRLPHSEVCQAISAALTLAREGRS